MPRRPRPKSQRWRDSKVWQDLRAGILRDTPLCEHCHSRPPTECHHEPPVRITRRPFDRRMIKALCSPCHQAADAKWARH